MTDKTQTRERDLELQILEAAGRCFRQFGSYKTSIQDVATEAGISRGTVYRYFGDRERLISAYIDHHSDQFLLSLADVLEKHDSLADRLASFAWLAVQIAREGREVKEAPVVDEETVTRKLTVGGKVTMEKSIEFLIPYFREARRKGEIRRRINLERAAEWAVRMIMSLSVSPSVTVDLSDEKDVRAFVRDHLVHGFC
jgi:AcrR family transcriptional regulator